MDIIQSIDTAAIEQALGGQLDQPSVMGLIETLQTRLDDLLPTANKAFANVVTEAFDMTQGKHSIGLAEALQNISVLQAELDAILFPADDVMLQAMTIDLLPSPEMLFSDPDHVPRFVEWTQPTSSSSQPDLPLNAGMQSGISTNSSLFGFDPNGDRFDA